MQLFYVGNIITDEDNDDNDEDQALKIDFEKLRQKAISQVKLNLTFSFHRNILMSYVFLRNSLNRVVYSFFLQSSIY